MHGSGSFVLLTSSIQKWLKKPTLWFPRAAWQGTNSTTHHKRVFNWVRRVLLHAVAWHGWVDVGKHFTPAPCCRMVHKLLTTLRQCVYAPKKHLLQKLCFSFFKLFQQRKTSFVPPPVTGEIVGTNLCVESLGLPKYILSVGKLLSQFFMPTHVTFLKTLCFI